MMTPITPIHPSDSPPLSRSPTQSTSYNVDDLQNWGQPDHGFPTILGSAELSNRDTKEDGKPDISLDEALSQGSAVMGLEDNDSGAAVADVNDNALPSDPFNDTSQEERDEVFGFSPDVDHRRLEVPFGEEEDIFGTYPPTQDRDIRWRDEGFRPFPPGHRPSRRATSDIDHRCQKAHPCQGNWDHQVPYGKGSFPVQDDGYPSYPRGRPWERAPLLPEPMERGPLLSEPRYHERGFHNQGPYLGHRPRPSIDVDCEPRAFDHGRDFSHNQSLSRYSDRPGPFY